MSIKLRSIIVAFTASALLALSGTVAAAGEHVEPCTADAAYAGQSKKKLAGKTWQSVANECGNVGVRVLYKNHPGGLTYFTSWTYAAKSVTRKPVTNYTQGAEHKVTSPAWAYRIYASFYTYV